MHHLLLVILFTIVLVLGQSTGTSHDLFNFYLGHCQIDTSHKIQCPLDACKGKKKKKSFPFSSFFHFSFRSPCLVFSPLCLLQPSASLLGQTASFDIFCYSTTSLSKAYTSGQHNARTNQKAQLNEGVEKNGCSLPLPYVVCSWFNSKSLTADTRCDPYSFS